MDVIGLHKNGIQNVVANLGTSLTTKQILILNQFFEHVIICFDGDESGYKAALRAAENSIVELRPEKISFLFLPDNHDPDSFANQNGKDKFLEFAKNNLVSIHKFIFDHYLKITDDNLHLQERYLKKIENNFIYYKRRVYKKIYFGVFFREN